MRVAALKPGLKCRWHGRALEFIERVKERRVNVFRCPDFVGLNGPDDRGLVEFTDHDLKEVEAVH
jgi:hypothetical protein